MGAKKGVASIAGNIQPLVGERVVYDVTAWYPHTPMADRAPEKVIWELFKKRANGKFTTTNIRKVGVGEFTFGQKAVGNAYRVEGYLFGAEMHGLAGLEIRPQHSQQQKITKVEVFDTHGNKISKPLNYSQCIIVRVYTVGMVGKQLKISLWEDDAQGAGHNQANNRNFADAKWAGIKANGIAEVTFALKPDFKKIANAIKDGAKDKLHEYYVTAEYWVNGILSKVMASNNSNVINPDFTASPSGGGPVEKPRGGQPKKQEKSVSDNIGDIFGQLLDWVEHKLSLKAVIKPDKPQEGGNKPFVVEGEQKKPDCGQKYCIKKGDKSELIREVNIRLAGFGGNVPTDEFTERTEKMIKQFQRDYMKVPETGRICGNVLRAIDEFSKVFDLPSDIWNDLACSCYNKGSKAVSKLRGIKELNMCRGFGDGTGENTSPEKSNKYEFPGIHRSLLFGLKAILFYLSKQKKYEFGKISSGYRCRFKNFLTTNHQGKAIDIQFNKGNWPIRGQLFKNIAELNNIKAEIFDKFMNTKTGWTQVDNFSLEPIGLNPDNTKIDGNHTYSWIHLDVRAFQKKYLSDKYFCKDKSVLNGQGVHQLALKLGFVETCTCFESFDSQKSQKEIAKADKCEDKFRRVAQIILKHEGGFINDPDDSGGMTNMGITIGTWKEYAKEDLGIDPSAENLKNITEDQATTIYRKRYWEPKGFCRIEDERVGLMIYDWTITSGGATKQLQKLLVKEFGQTIEIDGRFGEQTIKAVNDVEDQTNLLYKIAQTRKQYYINLAYDNDGKPTKNLKFLKGWQNRVDDCLTYSF